MYKILSIIVCFFALAMAGCDDDKPSTPLAEVQVAVSMPEGFRVKYAGQVVTLRSGRLEYSATTDSLGVARFRNLVPDIYSVSTSWELTGDEYVAMSDTVVENRGVVLNGSLSKEMIFAEKTLTVQLTKAVKQSLLISKIYASGTRDANNKTYVADGYVEIFNNSDEVEYADGLYLALVEAESVVAFPAAANPNFIYARQVYRFPGNGTEYPIAPGSSIVVANSAINHSANVSTSVDLSRADFEAKDTKFINREDVPAIQLIYTAFASLKYMNLINGGDNGLFLFRTTDDVSSYPLYYIPGKSSGNRYMQIPVGKVMDGVETLKNKTTTGPDVNSKRIHRFIDASYMFISASTGYTHESVDRKVDVSKSTSTRVYLRDSNNSLSDFKNVTDPTPRKYDKPLLLE